MISSILFMIILAIPVYIIVRKAREHKLNKMLTKYIGDDFLDQDADFGQNEKTTWRSQFFDKIVETYAPDFIVIFGIKRFSIAVIITIGYLIFGCFCCYAFDAPIFIYALSSGLILFIAYIVIHTKYQDAFSDYFEAQFPYALRLISRNLAVGQTIYSAVDAASLNLKDIMQREFKRISAQIKGGISFEEVLDKGEIIYPYKGYYVFSSYLKVSLQKGTSMRDILLSLADDLVSSQIIKKKTKALTSESRGAAIILACLPFIMLVSMFFLNKDSFDYLFLAKHGRYILIYVVFSVSLGFFIISRMIKKVEL